MWRSFHEYLKEKNHYQVFLPIISSYEIERHRALGELFFSFLKKSGKNFMITLIVEDGSSKIYFSMNGGIETLNTVYEGIVFKEVKDIDVEKFENAYIFRSSKNGEIREKNDVVDFFQYILEYSNSREHASYLLSLEFLHPFLYPDLFSLRIILAFRNGEVDHDLISLVSSYWSGGNGIRSSRMRIVRGKTGLIDPRSSSLALPFPGEILERTGIGVRSQVFLSRRNSAISIALGKFVSNSKPCVLEFPENEGQSMLLLGETGSGKSTLMISIFKKLSRMESPFLVLDPTGDTVERIMKSMDSEIADRVVYISPVESPVTMNLLEIPGYVDRDIAVARLAEDIIQVLRNVTEAESGIQGGLVGSRIEEIIRHSINGLVNIKGATLMDIYDIITREDMRRNFYRVSENDDFKEFLSNLEKFTQEDISSTRRTLSFIKANRILRSMVCSRKPSFSIYNALMQNKIILVSGDRGRVSEKVSTFILSTILSMFWISVQSRANRSPAFLFCDEFQEYANSSFQDMLILGRKWNLNLFMATTHLSTISQRLKDAIMANTKNYALFRISPSDALEFGEKFSIEREKLMFTGTGVAYIRSRNCSDFAKIDYEGNGSLNKEYFIKSSEKYAKKMEKVSHEEIIFDIRLLEHLHLETSIQNLKSIGEKIYGERDLESSIKSLEKSGYIHLENGRIFIRDDLFSDLRGKIVDKLLSMGNVVRLEGNDPTVLRCIPMFPNLKSDEFIVYIDPTEPMDGVNIFTKRKLNCDYCYLLDEFLSMRADMPFLRDICGIIANVDGDLLITTSKRISDALREYSNIYSGYPYLERYVRKTLIDHGIGEDGERILINGERVKTIKIKLNEVRKISTPYNFNPSVSLKIQQ